MGRVGWFVWEGGRDGGGGGRGYNARASGVDAMWRVI